MAAAPALTSLPIGSPGAEDEQFLLRAFRNFAQAAASLELSYAKLRAEVERLQGELAASNRELARSAEENAGMRVHLDRILAGLPCGVLVVSSDGRIARANPEALRLLANRADEAEPTWFGQLPPPVQKLLELSRLRPSEVEMKMADGAEGVGWLAARHALIREGADTSIYILRDVSERKRFDRMQARLQRDQELAEISALLAHEIRNPLGSLELFAGLLAESGLEAEQHQWVEHMQAGLRTLAATVNNVLHFHSLSEPERAPVDLGQLLGWARDFFLPLSHQAGVTFSLDNQLSGVVLPADRHRLEQVLANLVLNSIRAMPQGGWIQLSGRRGPDGQVDVAVADTGTGISPEDLPAIFQPGFSRRPGSPGLGLAVCRKIVEQHEGTIAAANRLRQGAIFTVTFRSAATAKGVQP